MSDEPKLPDEVPQHRDNGQQWFLAGLCVTCGGKKERPAPYHCDACYSAMYSSLMDYDDD